MTRILNFRQSSATASSSSQAACISPSEKPTKLASWRASVARAGRFLVEIVWAVVFCVVFAPIALFVYIVLCHELEYEEVIPCDLCSDPSTGFKDGHPTGEPCPNLLHGDCGTCLRVVALDRFGNCSEPGVNHCISNRRPAHTQRKEVATMKT